MTTPASIRLYGIPNCDTVKKARAWLTAHALPYEFHDFKKQGVPSDRLGAWLTALGHTTVVNRQGTTWRKLDPSAQAAVVDNASAAALLHTQPSAIKRPVVEWHDGRITVGFKAEQWARDLGLTDD